MSNWLLAATAAAYLFVAIDYALHRNPGMALSFLCYCGANFGFIWANMKGSV